MGSKERTIVGVPVFEKEPPEVLTACIRNIDDCLNHLGINAEIIIGINGPNTSNRNCPEFNLNRSQYNADIHFIKTPPGLVAAEKTIARKAKENGVSRIFLSDCDISRLPMSLRNMWEEGESSVVGANYATYPLEILIGAGIELSPFEVKLMQIFEADKHPLVREFTSQYRPRKRLKGSLLLVDTSIVLGMFDCQGITSDSQMNRMLSEDERTVVKNAAFMHYARVDLMDHIQGRLRHFRAAHSVGDLETFARKSLIYDEITADKIAQQIMAKYPYATEIASDFLLQSALRFQVGAMCKAIASNKAYTPYSCERSFEGTNFSNPVKNFREASVVVAWLLKTVDINSLNCPTTRGNGTTQNDHRIPIDLNPFLANEEYRGIIYRQLDYSNGDDI